MSLGADNANVMQGLHKGIAAFVKQIPPSVFVLGCPCHLMHLAAETACRQQPVVVEDILIYVLLLGQEFKQTLRLKTIPVPVRGRNM